MRLAFSKLPFRKRAFHKCAFRVSAAGCLFAFIALAIASVGAEPISVVVLGSSTAAGAGAYPSSQAWVNLYQAFLVGDDPRNTVTNLAIGGFTSYNILPDGTIPPPGRPGPVAGHNITAALALKPDAIIINLPSNDALIGCTDAEQQANFQTLARLAARANVALWVSTTQPRNLNDAQRANLMRMRDWIRDTFGRRALDFWTGLAAPDGSLLRAYDCGDGTHLNNAGHALLFRRAAAADLPGTRWPSAGGLPNDPYGDVDGDGAITAADASLVRAFLAAPGSLSAAQQDRIRRYGDVSGMSVRNEVGNGMVDENDVMRLTLVGSGIADAGTAGICRMDYGDVNGDGRTDIVDAVLVQRYRCGNVDNPILQARIRTRGLGDVSPTVSGVAFGSGTITAEDADVIAARASGTEANPAPYVDYWPLHTPTSGHPEVAPDQYTLRDTTGHIGDALGNISYAVTGVEERRGFTVMQVAGTDGSLAGICRGMDGALSVIYLRYPYAFGNTLVEFQTPLALLGRSVSGERSTWQGATITIGDAGSRPVRYTGTLLSRGDVYTPAAGAFPGSTPPSTWSRTVRLRLDVAILSSYASPVEMQQAFFFELAPYLGIVERGQASFQGAAAEMTDRPLLVLNSAQVRGISFSPTTP